MVHFCRIIVDNQQAWIVLYRYENDHDKLLKEKVRVDCERWEFVQEERIVPLVSFLKSLVGSVRGSLFA